MSPDRVKTTGNERLVGSKPREEEVTVSAVMKLNCDITDPYRRPHSTSSFIVYSQEFLTVRIVSLKFMSWPVKTVQHQVQSCKSVDLKRSCVSSRLTDDNSQQTSEMLTVTCVFDTELILRHLN